MRTLATALVLPTCRLTSLVLYTTELGTEGIRVLADVLRTPTCRLTELDITNSNDINHGHVIDDNFDAEAVNVLETAIRDPRCRLQRLLDNCDDGDTEGDADCMGPRSPLGLLATQQPVRALAGALQRMLFAVLCQSDCVHLRGEDGCAAFLDIMRLPRTGASGFVEYLDPSGREGHWRRMPLFMHKADEQVAARFEREGWSWRDRQL